MVVVDVVVVVVVVDSGSYETLLTIILLDMLVIALG